MCFTALEEVEVVARVAFVDDDRAGGVFDALEGIGDLGAFVGLQIFQQVHFLQEAFVHATLLEGAVHQDAAEGDAVESPEHAALAGRDNGGGARGVVHECELAEGAAGADGGDFLAHTLGPGLDAAAGVDVDVEFARLDDVEVVAFVALGDHFDVGSWYGFLLQGVEDGAEGVVVEVGEEEVAAHGGFEASELVVSLVVFRRLPVAAIGVGLHRFGGDGDTAAASCVVGCGRVLG